MATQKVTGSFWGLGPRWNAHEARDQFLDRIKKKKSTLPIQKWCSWARAQLTNASHDTDPTERRSAHGASGWVCREVFHAISSMVFDMEMVSHKLGDMIEGTQYPMLNGMLSLYSTFTSWQAF